MALLSFSLTGNPVIYPYMDKLYRSLYNIISEVCEKYAGAVFPTV